MKRLRRLRRMTGAEMSWRIRQTARIQRDRLRTRVRTPRWDRSAIAGALSPAIVDATLRAHLERKDWRAVNRAIAAALRARRRPFVLDPDAAVHMRDQVAARWPHAAADAARRADRIMGGHYDLLGYRDLPCKADDGRVDWHRDPAHARRAPRLFWADVPYLDPSIGDHKVIWELNRHQHWLALGRALWLTRDRRFGWAIVTQLEDWLDANPPLVGVNWSSMLELGFRSLSWIWAIHFLLADTDEGAAGPSQIPWLVDLLAAIDRQLRHVEENLSTYFSPNTHLTGEALALYVAGQALPELAASGRWTEIGRQCLLDEIERQIGADGGHCERSAHYQRYTLDFYLLALIMAERTQDGRAIPQFTDAVARLADFTRALADDAGRLPNIGDDDGGMLWPIAGRPAADVRDSLALAAVLLGRPDLAPWGLQEEVFWIAGRTALEQEPFVEAWRQHAARPASRTFPDAGYVVARDGGGGHLVFDAGPHGYLNGGHAHADALSITLGVAGHPMLVDPGTSTYTMDPALRDRLRGSESHNTLTLDGRPYAAPEGPFAWSSRADARLDAVRHNPAFDWAEGSHDGYGDARHRRTVFRTPAGSWLVVDEVLGRGRHAADLHWHFDPAWAVVVDAPRRLRAAHIDGTPAWIAHDGERTTLHWGDRESALGWTSPVYGTLAPTWTARVSREGPAPLAIATWISIGAARPALSRVQAECDPGAGEAVAVRALHGDFLWTTLLRPGEPEVREAREGIVGVYETNARLLHYGSRDGRFVALAACDFTHALALRDGWLSIAADEPMADVHVERVEDRINLYASQPAPRLWLQGELVRTASSIRLNGRELPEAARTQADTALALAWNWGEAQLAPLRRDTSDVVSRRPQV